jgi:hypothetical protein
MTALVAPYAGRKVITPEGALTVMAGHTAIGARAAVVLQWRGRRYLVFLRHSGSDTMAIRATQSLVRGVFRVAETYLVGQGDYRSSGIMADLVADIARGDVSSPRA